MKTKPEENMSAARQLLFQTGWMDYDMFCMTYGASKKTAWRWRKDGLPFSKLGGKIFLEIAKIQVWLDEHNIEIKPKKKNLKKGKNNDKLKPVQ